MLTNNHYYLKYRSFENDFDKDFLIPAYQESVLLQRGSGYFTVGSLIRSMVGILTFIENGGCIQLVCNPELSEQDLTIIEAGNSLSSEHITETLLHEIEKEAGFSPDEMHSLDIICNMIAEGRLQIKIAYMPTGIYHEKFGIFTDSYQNKVYFNGSANETISAKVCNMESFQVSVSWMGGEELIKEESEYFSKLWNNNIKHLKVIEFPEALELKLFEKYKKSKSLEEALNSEGESVGSTKKLYDFQEQAIDEFFAHNCSYFYEMATGTGKTFTAIRTIQELKKKDRQAIVCGHLCPTGRSTGPMETRFRRGWI